MGSGVQTEEEQDMDLSLKEFLLFSSQVPHLLGPKDLLDHTLRRPPRRTLDTPQLTGYQVAPLHSR